MTINIQNTNNLSKAGKANKKRFQIKVPGSSANLGPGFDCFGIALSLANYFTFCEHSSYELRFSGKVSLPADNQDADKNYVISAYQKACAELQIEAVPIILESEINLPMSAGIGSSATAIIAGCAIAFVRHAMIKHEESTPSSATKIMAEIREDLWQMAARIEGHPDNVSASVFGGFVICSMEDEPFYQKYEVGDELICYLIKQPLETETASSRQALSTEVNRRDAIFNISHASLVASAFAGRDYQLLAKAMKDRLHEEARDNLSFYTGLKKHLLKHDTGKGLEKPDKNVLGVAMSGSGPSILVLCTKESLEFVKQDVAEYFQSLPKNNVSESLDEFVLQVDNDGTQLSIL